MQTGLSAAAIGVTSTMRGYGWSVGIVETETEAEESSGESSQQPVALCSGSARGSLARGARDGGWRGGSVTSVHTYRRSRGCK
jgi:hypothetical protein